MLYKCYCKNVLICVSDSMKDIKRYVKRTRQISMNNVSIVREKNKCSEYYEDYMLTNIFKIVVPARDLRIIIRDFSSFMDDICDMASALSQYNRYLDLSSVREAYTDCYDIIQSEKKMEKVLKNFVNGHMLVTMNMLDYMMFQRDYPDYFKDI